MTTISYLNACIWDAHDAGTGDFIVGTAEPGYFTPAQCTNPVVVNGGTYRYFARNGAEHEEGFGVWTTATSKLTRATILSSSNSGSAVNFTAAPIVYMGCLLAQDVAPLATLAAGAALGQVLISQGLGVTPIFSADPLIAGTLSITPPSGLAEGLVITQAISGSPTGTGAYNSILINSDTANASGTDTDGTFGLYIFHSVGGATVKGSRSAIFAHMDVGADAAVSSTHRDFVGITSFVTSSAAMPVTATNATLFATSFGVTAGAGSTGLHGIVGCEVDISANVTGIPYVIGWNVSYNGSQAASTRSVAYEVSATATGWEYAIGLTTQSGHAALSTTGTVLAILEAHSLAKGIDFTNATFSGNAWTSTGASITSTGAANFKQTVTVTGTTNDGYAVTDSTVTGAFVTSALHTNSLAIGTSSNHAVVFIANNAEVGSVTETATTAPWVLGVAGTRTGSLAFTNITSGTITLQAVAGALGTVTLTLPAATDTVAVLAASQAFTNKTYNGLTVTSSTGTLTITNGKTLSVSNSLTFAGTDGKTLTISNSGTLQGGDAFVLSIAASKTVTHSATTTFAGTDGKTLTISNSGTLSGGDAFVLAIAAGKTLTVSNSLTLAGTDATTMTFPTTSQTIAGLGVSQTFTVAQTITVTQAVDTAADGLILADTTAATSGHQQYSPRIRFSGFGWKTDATAASQQIEWTVQAIPVQGAAHPANYLDFASRINGSGSYVSKFQVIDDGSNNTSVNFIATSSVQMALSVNGSNVGILYADTSQVITGAIANVPVNLTVNNTAVLILQTAGTVKFNNAASFSANNTVATVLGSVGPTGSHTTVQKWLTIVDSGGATLYIPCF